MEVKDVCSPAPQVTSCGAWASGSIPPACFLIPEMAPLVHHSDNICGGKVGCLVEAYFLDSSICVYENCIDVLKRPPSITKPAFS